MQSPVLSVQCAAILPCLDICASHGGPPLPLAFIIFSVLHLGQLHGLLLSVCGSVWVSVILVTQLCCDTTMLLLMEAAHFHHHFAKIALYDSHPDNCEAMSIHISLVTSDAEYLYMYLMVISMSSLKTTSIWGWRDGWLSAEEQLFFQRTWT